MSPEFATLVIRFGEKMKRADEHLKALHQSAKRFGETKGEPGILTTMGLNPKGTKYQIKVGSSPEFPEAEWGVIIGDAVHCLRSALDQFISGLCTEKPSGSTGFPICRTEREWVVDAPRSYWSVPASYLAAINRAQPYHRGDAAHMHPLAILNVLWNLDKHRSIPAVALVPSKITVDVIELRGVTLGTFRTFPGRPLKRGAVIAEANIAADGSGTQQKVNVDGHISIGVGFGTVERASLLTSKPVGQIFYEILMPALTNVLEDMVAAHHGQPFSTSW